MADKEKNAGQEAAVKRRKRQQTQTPPNPAKARKTVRKRKASFPRIAGWFKDLRKEFKKVVWPDRKKVFNNTLVVLVVVIVGSVLVGLIDSGLLKLMQFLMGLSN